ncbi:MAG: F0F1 ATP synthase subunit B' [Pseudomonadota bacterium]
MATETQGGEEAAVGLPQLDFATFPNQIFWLVVTLVAIYLILTKVALPRIAGVMAERQGSITNDLAQAEELKLKAQAAETAYEAKLADARSEAAKIVAEAKAEMQAELDAEIAKADDAIAAKLAESETRIAEIRDGALAAIKTVSNDVASEIVGALGGDADAGALRAAVDARMKD